MMNRNDFLNAVIDDGIYEITTTYNRPDQKLKREGGIAGFEACRGKSNEELMALLCEAKDNTTHTREADLNNYWSVVMYERQIEWTINVLSAAMHLQGETPIVIPTARGALKAASILTP